MLKLSSYWRSRRRLSRIPKSRTEVAVRKLVDTRLSSASHNNNLGLNHTLSHRLAPTLYGTLRLPTFASLPNSLPTFRIGADKKCAVMA